MHEEEGKGSARSPCWSQMCNNNNQKLKQERLEIKKSHLFGVNFVVLV